MARAARSLLRPDAAPWVPGRGIAGEVAAVGPEIADFEPGDAVFALLDRRQGGGYAQYAVVRHAVTAQKPDPLAYEEAAALAADGVTALQALRDLARLHAGQHVAVHGAAGGAGCFAVQIAAAIGAQVTAAAGPDQQTFLRQLGAERVVDDTREDFTTLGPLAQEAGDGDGTYDAIFDASGDLRFADCEPALLPGGIFVTVRRGPATLVARLRAGLAGLIDRHAAPRVALAAARADGDDLEALAQLVETGKLRPVVGRVLPLAEANRAHADLRTGDVRGSIVLRIP